jgi:hypothetical protein
VYLLLFDLAGLLVAHHVLLDVFVVFHVVQLAHHVALVGVVDVVLQLIDLFLLYQHVHGQSLVAFFHGLPLGSKGDLI